MRRWRARRRRAGRRLPARCGRRHQPPIARHRNCLPARRRGLARRHRSCAEVWADSGGRRGAPPLAGRPPVGARSIYRLPLVSAFVSPVRQSSLSLCLPASGRLSVCLTVRLSASCGGWLPGELTDQVRTTALTCPRGRSAGQVTPLGSALPLPLPLPLPLTLTPSEFRNAVLAGLPPCPP